MSTKIKATRIKSTSTEIKSPSKKKKRKKLGRPPKKGRPRTKFDLKDIEDLAFHKVPLEMIADRYNVNVRTINRYKANNNSSFCHAYKKGNFNRNYELRHLQFVSARGIPKLKKDKDGNLIQTGWLLQPSAAMQIFLGKQYLGQSDTPLEESDKDELPIDFSGWDVKNNKEK